MARPAKRSKAKRRTAKTSDLPPRKDRAAAVRGGGILDQIVSARAEAEIAAATQAAAAKKKKAITDYYVATVEGSVGVIPKV